MKFLRPIFAVAALALTATPAISAVVFSTDFEGALPTQITGAGVITSAGTLPIGQFGTKTFRNDTTGNPASSTVLTLSGLAAHTSLSVSFDFIAWDSWDGQVQSFPQGDFFNLLLGATNIFRIAPNIQSGLALIPSTAVLTFGAGGVNLGQSSFNDQVYRVTISGISHSASTATFSMFADGVGWQGGTDESWGIDNFVVSTETAVTAVPEPASWALMLTGFGIVGSALRRRGSLRQRAIA